MSNLKQTTISSLKGVVVMEDFLRHKNVLDNPNESEESVLSALIHLKKKKPSKEITSSTGIEASLKALENHSNEAIAKEAKSLSEYWEVNSTSKRKPTVEVRYDTMTMKIRRAALDFITKELGGEEENEKLADILEKEIFRICKKRISISYRRTARKIFFVLKYYKCENKGLKDGKIHPTDFVRKYFRYSDLM